MMDIGSLLLVVSIFILTVLFVIRPFFLKEQSDLVDLDFDNETREFEQRYSALLAEKERLLNTLQELDADHELGKIPEEDYPAQRTVVLAAAADVLREVDAVQEKLGNTPIGDLNEQTDPISDEMPPALTGIPDPIEEMVNARRQLREEKSAGFCPKCGKVIQKSDVFCARCGMKVSG